MDCPQGYHLQVHLHITTDDNLDIDTPIDPCHTTIMKTCTSTLHPDHSHIIKDTAAKVTITPTDAILGHSIGTPDNITGVLHDPQMLISTILTTTLHIECHLHTGTHQLPHVIVANHSLSQPTGQLQKPDIRIHHIPEDPKVINTLEEIQESQ